MKVAVIPARGGSKRIPRKNIRLFAGKPMIAYSIECAIRTQLFDRIVVSTDDAEISDIARRYGAEVPFVRPAELSDDLTFPAPVIAHAVRWLQNDGNALAAVCTIYPTAPFIREEDVNRAFEVLESGDWQYVFPATTFAYPVFRSFHQDEAGGLQMFFPEKFNVRSQDLLEALHDAGQFYWGRPRAWLDQLRVFDKHSTIVAIPRWRVQDIDNEEDWLRAEMIAGYLSATKQS
jgi:pseudaminic acid cytidylyltransferase